MNAARCVHRHAQRLREANRGFDVDASAHAVAADVGVDDAFDAVVFETLPEIKRVVPRKFAPAISSNLAVFGVEANDNSARKRVTSVVQEARIFYCGGADDDVVDAVVEIALDDVEVAYAAAELHFNIVAHFGEDRFNRALVDRLARERTVEINEMQACRALIDPMSRHRGRVFGEHGDVVHIALTKAHAMTVFEINGRNN